MLTRNVADIIGEDMIVLLLDFSFKVHVAAEGGYWGELTADPGVVSQGETLEELIVNMNEAYLAVKPTLSYTS